MKQFLDEDSGVEWRDVGNSVVEGETASASVLVNEEGVVAGLHEAGVLFDILGVEATPRFEDGDEVVSGDVVMGVEGDAAEVLRGERPALNLLGSMSGVATATKRCVEAAGDVVVAATRKTTPGYRAFEKKAVKVGGGDPHRYDLMDAVMVKDNHVELLGLEEAYRRVEREVSFTQKIEVEAESVDGAVMAAELGADIVLLDNMSPGDVGEAMDALSGFDVLVEASGGITLENVGEYVAAGVDVVSVGGLVHSSDWLEVSMNVNV